MIYDAECSVRRHPEINKRSTLSCFLIKDVCAQFVFIPGGGASERQSRAAGCDEDAAAGGCCALHFNRGVSGLNIPVGTALCLSLFGACPNIVCFFCC